MQRRALWAALASATLLPAAQRATAAQASLYALRDVWLDEHGHPLPLARFRHRPAIVAMEYSACRFVCTAYWRRLTEVQLEADRRQLDMPFVILSIDPDNDTPAAWRDYRRQRGLDRRNWHFLTAARPATERAAAWLGVRWWNFDGHLMHDFKLTRLDAEGRVLSVMASFDETPALLLDPA